MRFSGACYDCNMLTMACSHDSLLNGDTMSLVSELSVKNALQHSQGLWSLDGPSTWCGRISLMNFLSDVVIHLLERAGPSQELAKNLRRTYRVIYILCHWRDRCGGREGKRVEYFVHQYLSYSFTSGMYLRLTIESCVF